MGITLRALVKGPTVAIWVPYADAPSERKEEGEKRSNNPLSNSVTCALDTSFAPAAGEAHGAPLAHAFTGGWCATATM